MSGHRAPPGARTFVLALVVLFSAYLSVVGALLIRDPGQLVALCFVVPGAVVVLRRGGHPIGWLLVTAGLGWGLHAATEVVGGGLAWLPPAWRAWMFDWVGYAQWALTVALIALFPDGLAQRTPAQRRAARVAITTAVAVAAVAMLLNPVGRGSVLGQQPNPTALGVLPAAAADFLILPVAVACLGAVIGLWRRSRGVSGAQRRQYTWVLFAFSLVIVGLAIGLVFSGPIGDVAWYPILAGWFLVPTAFSIAILRHRLYDIDRIVSRTVAYAVITAIVAAVYAIPIVALSGLFELGGSLPVAAATLGAAAAFSPVRRLVQGWVDRHFNRARFDARRELDAFAARLRAQVDLETVLAEVHALVDATLRPSTAVTWIRTAQPQVQRAAADLSGPWPGQRADQPPSSSREAPLMKPAAGPHR